jgi:hypothetical protein
MQPDQDVAGNGIGKIERAPHLAAMTNTPLPHDTRDSDRLRGVALALNIPLGVFGAHRFYVGKIGTGILQLCTLGGLGLWWLADLILIAAGEFRDIEGKRLTQWSRDEAEQSRRERQPSGRLAEEVEAMQTEMHELAERVDFLERLLAQARERGQLRAGAEER